MYEAVWSKYALWAIVLMPSLVSAAVENKVYPPAARLEYDIGIKIFASGNFDSVLEAIESGTLDLLDEKGIETLELSTSTGGQDCYPWYRFRKNRGCTRASYILEAYPLDQEQADSLENLAGELVELIATLNKDAEYRYELTWVTEPHVPRDRIEFGYKIAAQPNPLNLTAEDALAIFEDIISQQFAEAGIEFRQQEIGWGPCNNDDDSNTTMCLNVDHSDYTNKEGCQPLVTKVVQSSIVTVNSEFEWFHVNCTDLANMLDEVSVPFLPWNNELAEKMVE